MFRDSANLMNGVILGSMRMWEYFQKFMAWKEDMQPFSVYHKRKKRVQFHFLAQAKEQNVNIKYLFKGGKGFYI